MKKAMNRALRLCIFVVPVLAVAGVPVHAADCNENGTDDAIDIQNGVSADCNLNGIPDVCDLATSLLFDPPVDYAVGSVPVVIVTAELNGVAGLDLITANSADRNVSVLLNNGDGTYASAVPYPTDRESFSVAVGDFDGVQGVDIAAATKNDTVSILLNNGDGTFTAGGDFPTLGDRPMSIASGDLDAVNGPDLVVPSRDENTLGVFSIAVLINNGDGTFAAAVTYAVQDTPSHVLIDDFDGINGLDIAVANKQSDTISVLLNQGDGTFAAAVNRLVGNGPVSIAAEDFDGDTDIDLAVVTTGSDSIAVLLNNGAGTFSLGGGNLVGFGPVSVAARDFDGDDIIDLVVANRGTLLVPGMSVSVLLGRGDGTFLGHTEISTSSSPMSVVAADLNLDGLSDIATAHDLAAGNVSVLLLGEIGQFSEDCNTNDVPDECDIAGTAEARRAGGRQGGGPVFLSGDDADDLAHCPGTACGALFPTIFSFAIANSVSPGTGIVAIGVNPGSALTSFESWNDPLNGGPGAAVTILTDPAAIAAVSFTDFAVLYIPSVDVHTGGGITLAQLDALNARQGSIVDFVNISGGGLIALTQAGVPNAYGWLPFPIEFADQMHTTVCPTAALTDVLVPMADCANMSHGFYHTIFTGPPGFLGMNVLALSTDAPVGQVVMLGGANVVIGGRITLTSGAVIGPACSLHTITATVTDGISPFDPLEGMVVTFNVIDGPNFGVSGMATTDVNGQASFSFTGKGGPGIDRIQAEFDDSPLIQLSNIVTMSWGSVSEDCNGNGIPDECEPIEPGDTNADGIVNLTDSPTFLDCLGSPCGSPPCVPANYVCIPCCGAGDFDSDGAVDLADYAEFQTALTLSP